VTPKEIPRSKIETIALKVYIHLKKSKERIKETKSKALCCQLLLYLNNNLTIFVFITIHYPAFFVILVYV
jgi:hypothetical protein